MKTIPFTPDELEAGITEDSYILHERIVQVRPLSEHEVDKCADCSYPAALEVREKPDKQGEVAVWYWCGNCDIGG
jgi:hypothetical protein